MNILLKIVIAVFACCASVVSAQTEQAETEESTKSASVVFSTPITFEGKIEDPIPFFKEFCGKNPVKDEFETKAEFAERCSKLEKPPAKVFYFSGRNAILGGFKTHSNSYDVETSAYTIFDDDAFRYFSFKGTGTEIEIYSNFLPVRVGGYPQWKSDHCRLIVSNKKDFIHLVKKKGLTIEIKMPRDVARVVRDKHCIIVYGITFQDYTRSSHIYDPSKLVSYFNDEVLATYNEYEIEGKLVSVHLVSWPDMKEYWSTTVE